MKCLLTYQSLKKGEKNYSTNGLMGLNRKLKDLKIFPYTASEIRREAQKLASKLSIQGIQPKVSVSLNLAKEVFETAEKGGTYILKPQVTDFPHMPENEDLTMKLARQVGIQTPWHGLIRCSDQSLAYVIKRFDRVGKFKKLPQEDFAQLIGASRATKYQASTERVALAIEEFCTFQILENLKFFKLLLFSFLVGNEDLHLKNLSVTTQNGKTTLTPAYDLINSTIVLAKPQEELALELNNKKSSFKREDFTEYLAEEVLFLSKKQIQKELALFENSINKWLNLIDNSFLSDTEKKRYWSLFKQRAKRIFT